MPTVGIAPAAGIAVTLEGVEMNEQGWVAPTRRGLRALPKNEAHTRRTGGPWARRGRENRAMEAARRQMVWQARSAPVTCGVD